MSSSTGKAKLTLTVDLLLWRIRVCINLQAIMQPSTHFANKKRIFYWSIFFPHLYHDDWIIPFFLSFLSNNSAIFPYPPLLTCLGCTSCLLGNSCFDGSYMAMFRDHGQHKAKRPLAHQPKHNHHDNKQCKWWQWWQNQIRNKALINVNNLWWCMKNHNMHKWGCCKLFPLFLLVVVVHVIAVIIIIMIMMIPYQIAGMIGLLYCHFFC